MRCADAMHAVQYDAYYGLSGADGFRTIGSPMDDAAARANASSRKMAPPDGAPPQHGIPTTVWQHTNAMVVTCERSKTAQKAQSNSVGGGGESRRPPAVRWCCKFFFGGGGGERGDDGGSTAEGEEKKKCLFVFVTRVGWQRRGGGELDETGGFNVKGGAA